MRSVFHESSPTIMNCSAIFTAPRCYEISDVLARLTAGGVQLAIVSSNSGENVERVLGANNARVVAHFASGQPSAANHRDEGKPIVRQWFFVSMTFLAGQSTPAIHTTP